MYDKNGWRESSEGEEQLDELKRELEKMVKLCANLEDEILDLRIAEGKATARILKLTVKIDRALTAQGLFEDALT